MIINLVGASGSGKTTVAQELEKLGHNIVHSYTTRKPRHKNEWGHIFIQGAFSNDNRRFETKDKTFYRDDMIAFFNNYNNIYFATDKQIVHDKVNIYPIDPKGALEVKEYYKDTDTKVITIFIQTDENVRAERLAKRINDQSILKVIKEYKTIPDVWDRLRPDREIFKIVECDYVINGNGKVKHTLDRITSIIEEEC